MQDVPFYPNNDQDNHCMLAVYRMLFDHFLHKKLNWEQTEEFVGYKNGKAAWTLQALTKMAHLGFDIHMIEPFDYREYLHRGEDFIRQILGPDKAAWMLEHSNILDIKPFIPDFLRTVRWENRRATLQDIDNMLTLGRLVFVTLNSRALNGKPGYSDHAVLVIGREDGDYIVHDPGLPPKPARHVSRQDFWQAMGGEDNTSEVTGFKLRSQAGQRVDVYVAELRPALSRAFIQKLCESGQITVNGEPTKPGYKLRAGDDVQILFDEAEQAIPQIDLPVLYEDDDCLVVNKPAGILTHALGKHGNEPSVSSFLRQRLAKNPPKSPMEHAAPFTEKGFAHFDRAGIVHRLDRATSGVIICAKNDRALQLLQKQFSARQAKKTYVAIVRGHLDPREAVIDMPIERNPKEPSKFRVGANGKAAVTQYKVLEEGSERSLVELKPQTGRTHQLRVHLAKIGHPIVGDPLYGDAAYTDRMMLHAKSLEVTLPNGEHKTFEAPLPPEFQEVMA